MAASRLADEIAFLPAALSLQETPVHPAPRRFAWGLTLLFVLALLWSFFGQVDIVAVAPGRIMVSERTKVIQPLEASVVRKVLVKDGDRVKAGQVLVELDPTMASADMASVQEQLRTQASEVMRTGALLKSLSNSKLLTPVLRGDSFLSAALTESAEPVRAERTGTGWLLRGTADFVPALHLASSVLIPHVYIFHVPVGMKFNSYYQKIPDRKC